jgi:hypothetical protein
MWNSDGDLVDHGSQSGAAAAFVGPFSAICNACDKSIASVIMTLFTLSPKISFITIFARLSSVL